MQPFLRYWLPVLLLAGLILCFSTDVFSSENTAWIVGQILQWFLPAGGPAQVEPTNFGLRKAAHFLEYAVLAALLFRAFRADTRVRWRLAWVASSLLFTSAWACVDEFLQSLTLMRSGSLDDVLLDSVGGLCALLIISAIALVVRWRHGPRLANQAA
jgi:VanZ family protein